MTPPPANPASPPARVRRRVPRWWLPDVVVMSALGLAGWCGAAVARARGLRLTDWIGGSLGEDAER